MKKAISTVIIICMLGALIPALPLAKGVIPTEAASSSFRFAAVNGGGGESDGESDGESEPDETEDMTDPVDPKKLNIVIDGGLEPIEAGPGEEIDIKIRLINNCSLSSLKFVLSYDEDLSVKVKSNGHPKVDFGISALDDETTLYDATDKPGKHELTLNWFSLASEAQGDCIYATVGFKVSVDAEPGTFLPIVISDIKPDNVFDYNRDNVDFNVINGGLTVADVETDTDSSDDSEDVSEDISEYESEEISEEDSEEGSEEIIGPGDLDPKKLNIVIDGGLETMGAEPGEELDIQIRLINNKAISSVKISLYYDSDLSVVTKANGKPQVKFGIAAIDEDSTIMATSDDNPQKHLLVINWQSIDSRAEGDCVFATVRFRVSENAEPGTFLPLSAEIHPDDIFKFNDKNVCVNVDFNLIEGGITVIDAETSDTDWCESEEDSEEETEDSEEISDDDPEETSDTEDESDDVSEDVTDDESEEVSEDDTKDETEEESEPLTDPTELDPKKLNIVIDGGAEAVKAVPGQEIDLNIKLVNNRSICCVWITVFYDQRLSVAAKANGKPNVSFGLCAVDDYALVLSEAIDDPDEHKLLLKWQTIDSEVQGDCIYTTVRFIVSENAEQDAFLSVRANINPDEVYEYDFDNNDMINVDFKLINGGITVSGHNHKKGSVKYDKNRHWYECTVCGIKLESADHTFGEEHVKKAASCTENGKAEHTCTVCGYTEEYTLYASGHKPGKIYQNEKNHWSVCGICGEKINVSSHKYGESILIKDAGCTKEGTAEHFCTVCGYTEKYTLEALGHQPGVMQSDEKNHWRVCEICGEKLDYAPHEYGKARVLKEASCTEPGESEHTCKICGRIERFETQPQGHVADKFEHDEKDHWHECVKCGKVFDVTAHTYGEERIIKPPTYTETGEAEHTCTVCGYTEKYVLDMLERDPDDTGKDQPPEGDKGDCNGDGEVNNKDVVVLFRSVSDGQSVYEAVFDFNGDGEVNNKDVVELFRFIST